MNNTVRFMRFTDQDIYDAYRKFKTFVYYNGQPLTLRNKLAEFEIKMLEGENHNNDAREDFIRKFKNQIDSLCGLLNNDDEKYTKDFEGWLKDIKYSLVPKQLKETTVVNEHFISNEVPIEDYIVQKCNFIIDAPIEIYLISTLWTIKLGRRLHNHISRDNYAYRLSIFDGVEKTYDEKYDTVSSGLMLYDPYFIGYQQWRDNGLNKVSQALNNKENAVILSLDIKRYFYNIKINVTDLVKTFLNGDEKLKQEEERLCGLLQRIHERYANVFSKFSLKVKGKVMLPLGLPSSGLLGNLTLKPFDDYVRNYVTPTYYGRYVDDILLVFSGKGLKITKHQESASYIDGFISDHLVTYEKGANISSSIAVRFLRNPVPSNRRGSEGKANTNSSEGEDNSICKGNGISYSIEFGDSKFQIQLSKVIMEYFNCNESRAAINKFKKQLEKNRSEFRYLPWEEEINLEFDDEAFRLEISDSINKLRNIEGISEDKYGASKYLAKKIFLSTLPFDPVSKEDTEASAKQILTYFKGRTTILMNSLWEKVATYFVINNQPKHLEYFWKQAITAIEKVTVENTEDDPDMPKFDEEEVKSELTNHLKLSIAMAISIIPTILTRCFINKKENDEFRIKSMNFRRTYLFRHQYQYLKGYCYTFNNDEGQSLVGKNLISEKVEDIQLGSYAPYVSPVFLKPHEIALLHIYHQLSNNISPNHLDITTLDEIFRHFNYEWRNLFQNEAIIIKNTNSKYFRDCLKVVETEYSNPIIQIVEINDEQNECHLNSDKRIGIVNWKIEQTDLIKSILGQPNKSNHRREKLFEVLNYSAKKNVEMLVFPETSIPVEWLPLLADHSVRNNCAIIGGLEFYVTPSKGKTNEKDYLEGMEAYNLSFNIFPVKMRCYDTAAFVIRKKNYYAPSEQQLLAAYHKKEPNIEPMYHLIHWRKAYFSTYNCFELSNISDRAIFKSKVDFIVAIEYNRDIHYFTNITESWTRDLHCFIVQTNSSDYGDTKVVQPTKNIYMDVMKIKGGDFPIVMITTLHIDELRKYHRQDVSGQLNEKSSPFYKPTPACYEWKWAERRIANESPSAGWFLN